jgi:hypothetical protein
MYSFRSWIGAITRRHCRIATTGHRLLVGFQQTPAAWFRPPWKLLINVQTERFVMGGGERIDGGPRSAIVVGAGIVGLSTAWFLQERGVDVTVVDRTGVAAGASWGNAGWIAPALTLPLNSPAALRYGLRALRDPAAPCTSP